MSLRDSVTKSFDGVVHTFIEMISAKYELPEEELLNMWEGNTTNKPTKKIIKDIQNTPSSSDTNNNRSKTELMKCSKNELVEMCKQRGVKRSGSKADLAGRLTGDEVVNTPTKNPKTTTSTPIAKKIVAKISKISVNRNQFGNYEHPETGLVFNTSLIVIGKQRDDGSVDTLTESDIDSCNQFKFKYQLPENLDTEVLDDEIIDELDEEEDDGVEEEDDGVEEEEDDGVKKEEGEEEDLIEEEDLLEEEDIEYEEEYESD